MCVKCDTVRLRDRAPRWSGLFRNQVGHCFVILAVIVNTVVLPAFAELKFRDEATGGIVKCNDPGHVFTKFSDVGICGGENISISHPSPKENIVGREVSVKPLVSNLKEGVPPKNEIVLFKELPDTLSNLGTNFSYRAICLGSYELLLRWFFVQSITAHKILGLVNCGGHAAVLYDSGEHPSCNPKDLWTPGECPIVLPGMLQKLSVPK